MARYFPKENKFGIILDQIKNERNVGTLARTFLNFKADFVATVGARYKRSCGDTGNAVQHIPFFNFDNWKDCKLKIPGWPLIGVELTSKSRCITKFEHPKNCIYVFGREDGSISEELQKYCQYMIQVPTFHCMNISVCAGIILYDRYFKNNLVNNSNVASGIH